MDGIGLHIFLAITALVLGFVASMLARDLLASSARRRVASFAERAARNDARLWAAVFGPAGYLDCDGADSHDPVSARSREAACGALQSAIDAGTIAFGGKSRNVRVLGCEPDEGAGEAWNLRRFPLRDAAGHRYALRARFPFGFSDPEPPRLWEGSGTEVTIRLDGIEGPSREESAARTRLRRLAGGSAEVPWERGISR